MTDFKRLPITGVSSCFGLLIGNFVYEAYNYGLNAAATNWEIVVGRSFCQLIVLLAASALVAFFRSRPPF